MMVKGTNIKRSHAVRRNAWTSLGFKVWPAPRTSLLTDNVQGVKHIILFQVGAHLAVLSQQ